MPAPRCKGAFRGSRRRRLHRRAGCPLQAELDPDGFLGKLKLRAYKAVIEERVPREQWETISVVVRVTGRPERQLRYGEILRELAAFEQGIPECATCPLAGGKPLGCYRYVTNPVDAVAERVLFQLFVLTAAIPGAVEDGWTIVVDG